MKKLQSINEKKVCGIFSSILLTPTLMMYCAFAAGNKYNEVVRPIITLLNQLAGPLLGLVGAVGSLYCILLGVKFAKAEEPQEREKAKSHLKNAIIGFVLIFALMIALNVGMGLMIDWVNESASGIGVTKM